MFNINDINALAEISAFDEKLLAGIIISLLVALIALWLCFRNLRRARLLRSLLQGLVAVAMAMLIVIVSLLSININTYQRLTYEQHIASISFNQSGVQRYQAFLLSNAGVDPDEFSLQGDEWQIDARIIKWQYPATLFGLNSQYRLERLNGRYTDIQQEQQAVRTVYQLHDDKGLSITKLLLEYPDKIRFVDSYYGNSVYLPMVDKGKFEIVLTQSGLIARPLNRVAEKTILRWR